MKLFNHRLSLTTICSPLLTLLGFSCSSDHGLMYGMPIGNFEVKGSVTDNVGNEVYNAEIRVTYPEASSGIYKLEKTRTDTKGNYEIKGNNFLPEMKVVCIPEDTDLQPDSVIVKMDYKDQDKHNSWDHGHAEKTVNFKLKGKND